MILTEAGEHLVQYARKMLDIEAETLSEVKGRTQSQGSLTIRAPQSIGNSYLPEVLAEYRRRFPGVSLNFDTCAFHSLEHELQTGVTDLAFLLAESINSASLQAESLSFPRLLMVSNVGHRLAQKSKVSIGELSGEPIFVPKADCGYRMMFEQMLTEARVKPQALLEFSSIEMLKACLKRSRGEVNEPGNYGAGRNRSRRAVDFAVGGPAYGNGRPDDMAQKEMALAHVAGIHGYCESLDRR